ncbi:MAG: hypothetical protein GX491_08225 [Chloroflexi bacterium]|nr:hypothetical protein [Chloroflexota bacterium]
MDISLALGGGGIKGISHLGVLACLEEAGFKIRAIAGTSAGALVGAVYAAGYSPGEILKIVESIPQKRLYARLPGDGPSLLGYAGLAEALTAVLGDCTFSDLKIPFACTAVDINTSQEIYLNEGSVMEAAFASIAIPGVFPTKIRGKAELVDGGVLDPVPVNLARRIAPDVPVVAVVLNPAKERWDSIPPQFNMPAVMPLPIPSPIIEGFARMRIGQAFRIFVHSMDITMRMLSELRLEVDKPDFIIRPNVDRYGMLDFAVPAELVRLGEESARQSLPELKRMFSWQNVLLRRLNRTGLFKKNY